MYVKQAAFQNIVHRILPCHLAQPTKAKQTQDTRTQLEPYYTRRKSNKQFPQAVASNQVRSNTTRTIKHTTSEVRERETKGSMANISRAHAMQQNAQTFCWDSARSYNGCGFAPNRPMALTRPQPPPIKEATGAKKLPGLRSLGEDDLFAGPHSAPRAKDLNNFRKLVDEMRADEAQAESEAGLDGRFRHELNVSIPNLEHMQTISEDEALAIALSLSLAESGSQSPDVEFEQQQEEEQSDAWEVVDMRDAGLVPQPNVIESEEDSFVNLVVQRSYAAVLGQVAENRESAAAVTWQTLSRSSSNENLKRAASNKVASPEESGDITLPSFLPLYGSVNSLAHEEADSILKSAARKRYTAKHRR
jgi:hypothetical protein